MTSATTLGDWLDIELSSVEQGLAVRVRAALPPGWRDAPVSEAAALFTDAAVGELSLLLERGCETRWAAPSLLAADALATYACELLAVAGGDVGREAEKVFHAISAVLPQPDEAA